MKHLTYLLIVLYTAFATAGCASKGDLAEVDRRLRSVEGQIQSLKTTTQPAPVQVVLPPDMLKRIDRSVHANAAAIRSVSQSIKDASPNAGLDDIAESLKQWRTVVDGSQHSRLYVEVTTLLSRISEITEKILKASSPPTGPDRTLVQIKDNLDEIKKELDSSFLTEVAKDYLKDRISDLFGTKFICWAATSLLALFGIKKAKPSLLPQPLRGDSFWVVWVVLLVLSAALIGWAKWHGGTARLTRTALLQDRLTNLSAEIETFQQHPQGGPATDLTTIAQILASIKQEMNPLIVTLNPKNQAPFETKDALSVLGVLVALGLGVYNARRTKRVTHTVDSLFVDDKRFENVRIAIDTETLRTKEKIAVMVLRDKLRIKKIELSTAGQDLVQKFIENAVERIAELDADIATDQMFVLEAQRLAEPTTEPIPALIQAVNALLGTMKINYAKALRQQAQTEVFIQDAEAALAAGRLSTDSMP